MKDSVSLVSLPETQEFEEAMQILGKEAALPLDILKPRFQIYWTHEQSMSGYGWQQCWMDLRCNPEYLDAENIELLKLAISPSNS